MAVCFLSTVRCLSALQIFEVHTKKMAVEAGVDFDALACLSKGLTGAEIEVQVKDARMDGWHTYVSQHARTVHGVGCDPNFVFLSSDELVAV